MGRNLHLHPAIFVGGLFDEEVDAYEGIPQSFYIDHFLELARSPDSGYLLMPAFGPVVDSYGQAHAINGLFVADASLFPSSIGIPPMLTIAAMADRIARRLAASWPP